MAGRPRTVAHAHRRVEHAHDGDVPAANRWYIELEVPLPMSTYSSANQFSLETSAPNSAYPRHRDATLLGRKDTGRQQLAPHLDGAASRKSNEVASCVR